MDQYTTSRAPGVETPGYSTKCRRNAPNRPQPPASDEAEGQKQLAALIRTDIELFESYRYAEKPPLDCPISVFGGKQDPLVTRDPRIDGVPVGVELGKYYLRDAVTSTNLKSKIENPKSGDGSIIIVIATDAPLDHRQLQRLASRSMSGLARTGSAMTNGSGDYAIAFSTANRINASDKIRSVQVLGNDAMSPLFQAVIEATEEAIYNSILRATTVTGKEKRTIEALPIDRVKDLLKKYGKVK